jgi:hypothetical protein
MEIRSVEVQLLHADRRTDMKKLILPCPGRGLSARCVPVRIVGFVTDMVVLRTSAVSVTRAMLHARFFIHQRRFVFVAIDRKQHSDGLYVRTKKAPLYLQVYVQLQFPLLLHH